MYSYPIGSTVTLPLSLTPRWISATRCYSVYVFVSGHLMSGFGLIIQQSFTKVEVNDGGYRHTEPQRGEVNIHYFHRLWGD